MKFSIISTMYRSSPYLVEFTKRVVSTVESITLDYELIFVNDGSPDDSLQVVLGLKNINNRIRIIELSRNFGHHAAIVAGLEEAKGEYVFLIDCDLEEQPEWLLLFEKEMKQSGADVVYGVQQKRVASALSNLLGNLFWRALNVMSSVKIPNNPMTCRLMNRAYVDALLNVGDRVLYLAGVFAWTGFNQKSIALVKIPRPTNHQSTYSLSKKLVQFIESFFSFSIAPLLLVFVIGAVTWMISILYACYLLINKFLFPEMVQSGFTSLMFSVWFLSGFIIMALGIIGLYISKIFQEVKRRPLYIVKKIHGGSYDE